MNSLSLSEQLELVLSGSGEVATIRDMFLELAIKGKLVEQRLEDGTLTADIQRYNKSIVPPSFSAVAEFDIPDSWSWLRLGEIGKWGAGATPLRSKNSYYDGSIPWFKSGELTGSVITVSEESITELALSETSVRINEPGTVLIAMYGATIGKTAIAGVRCTTNQAVCGCVPFGFVNSDYLHLLLKAFKSRFVGQGAGGAQPNISKEKIVATVVPLPPLAEQKRIVAKVDQLMALCDELEAKQNAQRQLGTRLTRSALDALTTATTPDEFTTAWHRIIENFTNVIDSPDKMAALRGAVVTLGLRGVLGPLQPGQKSKPVTWTNCVADVPYELPNHWSWQFLEDVVESVTDGDHQPPPKQENGVAFLTIGNVSSGRIDFSESRFVGRKYFDALDRKRVPTKGDILYTVVGASYGRPVKVDDEREFCVQRHIAIIRPGGTCFGEYVYLFLRSPQAYKQATDSITGTAQPTVPLRPLRKFKVPVPPNEEQMQIVRKVDALLALCDQLETQLRNRDEFATKLAAAFVQQLVV